MPGVIKHLLFFVLLRVLLGHELRRVVTQQFIQRLTLNAIGLPSIHMRQNNRLKRTLLYPAPHCCIIDA